MNRSRAFALTLLVLASACAPLSLGSGNRDRDTLWEEAHLALQAQRFSAADSLFSRLAERYPETREGQEALFYTGAIRLDPRNPGWSSRAAEESLRRYLALTESARSDRITRHPEAAVFLELATQLNMPVGERIPALQPDTVVRTRVVQGGGTRRVVGADEARALAADVERLRRELGERDATIRELREELARIRRTLTPGRRP